MFKKLILIVSLYASSYAGINDVVQNLLGNSDYNTHRNLINHIFANSNNFYRNGQIDYTKVTQELSNNGILRLDLGSISDVEVTFNFNSNPKKSMKNLTDILRVVGQQNFITQGETVVDNQLKWTIKIKTAAAISPLRLSQELQAVNCKIVDIRREGTYKWSYFIDSSNSTIYKAEDLVTTNQLSLRKPTKPYIIQVDNISSVTVVPKVGNSWYPSVIFYDNDFNILEVVEKDSLHKSLKLDVPNNTKYIKIDDFYSLANLKQGINITKE